MLGPSGHCASHALCWVNGWCAFQCYCMRRKMWILRGDLWCELWKYEPFDVKISFSKKLKAPVEKLEVLQKTADVCWQFIRSMNVVGSIRTQHHLQLWQRLHTCSCLFYIPSGKEKKCIWVVQVVGPVNGWKSFGTFYLGLIIWIQYIIKA